MAGIVCECDDVSFGHVGRPNCVITMGALAFPIFSPRNRVNGLRNYLPTNAASILIWLTDYGVGFADINTTLGLSPALTADSEVTIAHVVDFRLSASTAPQDRLYPILKVENATFPRTEDVFETAPSGRKIPIEGVGGIRSLIMELWGDDASHGVARELKKFGCSDLDLYMTDVTGNLWGIQDIVGNGKSRGYEMATETFISFMEFATDTTAQKIMLSFDLDAFECEENSWPITSGEFGRKFTTIEPLIQGFSTATSTSTTTTVVVLTDSFGTAGNKGDIVGLAPDLTIGNVNLVIKDSVDAVQAGTAIAEAPKGTYTITTAVLPSGDYTVTIKAAGYHVPVAKFTIV